MKRIALSLLGLIGCCYVANAQQDQIRYTPFNPNQSRPNQSQSEAQSTRTTAYYIDIYSNRIYKAPLKIQQQRGIGGVADYYVTEYYIDGGVGGRWQRITAVKISKCNSMLASNQLEKQFMYKALVNGNWHYFDF